MITFMYTWVIVSLLVSLPLLWFIFIRVMFKGSYEIEGFFATAYVISVTLSPIMNIATNIFFGYLLLRVSGIIR
jgi:hypothetical protein